VRFFAAMAFTFRSASFRRARVMFWVSMGASTEVSVPWTTYLRDGPMGCLACGALSHRPSAFGLRGGSQMPWGATWNEPGLQLRGAPPRGCLGSVLILCAIATMTASLRSSGVRIVPTRRSDNPCESSTMKGITDVSIARFRDKISQRITLDSRLNRTMMHASHHARSESSRRDDDRPRLCARESQS
jgi:hypothetical protein